MKKLGIGFRVCGLSMLLAGGAMAQTEAPAEPPTDAPPPAETTAPAEPAPETTAAATADTSASAGGTAQVGTTTGVQTTVAAPQAAAANEGPDHDRFVGRFAVGYFGISQIPLATEDGGSDPVSAPAIGVRYWLSPKLGLDLGLGFVIAGGSSEVDNGVTDAETTDDPTTKGLLIHAGLPIALSCGEHFCFEVIPELNFGFASATVEGDADLDEEDLDLSGNRLELGARVGAEIHFGFIGIPELSLVGSVGLHYRRDSISGERGDASGSRTTWALATTAHEDPWALFTNNISALYYF